MIVRSSSTRLGHFDVTALLGEGGIGGHMRLPALAIALLVVTSLAAPGQAQEVVQEPSIELPEELARVLTDYETAWRRGDAVALARLFAEGGFVLSPRTPPIRGRGSIKEHYAGGGSTLLLRAIAYATEGSVGYIIGGYRYQDGPDVGTFTLTLKRAPDGRWLIFSDMDNSNRPPELE
jgi:ketosteroid isomerase-like protein